MVVQEIIEDKLKQSFAPQVLEVQNESHMHSVPKNSETHFRVVLVSDQFIEKSRVQRHRMVNEVLKAEIDGPVHALSLKLFTVSEWEQRVADPAESPLCHSKKNS